MGGTSWIGQSRSTFRRGKYGKRTRGLEPTKERQASTASRLRTSRLIFPTTSTSSGIGCRRAVIIRRRCDGLTYRKEMDGRTRPLGIPTVADRIAQTVVKRYLEPLVEPCFHQDSYGYRPGKSALDAVGVARQRCWRYAWVLDLDIQSFFDQHRFQSVDACGPQAHGLPVGASLHRTMAESARADGGWEPRREGKRHATGWGHKPDPVESLSALHVRHLDARGTIRTSRSSAMPMM